MTESAQPSIESPIKNLLFLFAYGFWMFGNNVEKEQKLRDFAKSSLDNPKYKNKIKKILSKLKLSEDEVVQAYADYDMDIFAYKNEIYKSIALRVA